MFDLAFRQSLGKHSGGAVRFFISRGISANTMTTIGLCLGLCSAFSVALDFPILAVALWWISRLFDGFDGLIARATGTASPGGAFFDLTADMVAYGAMVIGFSVAHPGFSIGWSLILYGYLLVTVTALALGSQEEKAGIPNSESRNLRLGVGFAEAGETGAVYTLFCLFPNFIGVVQPLWILILTVTFIVRCKQSLKMSALSCS